MTLKISFIGRRRNYSLKDIEWIIRSRYAYTHALLATMLNQLSEFCFSGNVSLVEKYWYDANRKRIKNRNLLVRKGAILQFSRNSACVCLYTKHIPYQKLRIEVVNSFIKKRGKFGRRAPNSFKRSCSPLHASAE